MTKLMYDKLEAADQLSISVRVLERLISTGEIESVLIGRRRLVPAAALDDYIDRVRKSA